MPSEWRGLPDVLDHVVGIVELALLVLPRLVNVGQVPPQGYTRDNGSIVIIHQVGTKYFSEISSNYL